MKRGESHNKSRIKKNSIVVNLRLDIQLKKKHNFGDFLDLEKHL